MLRKEAVVPEMIDLIKRIQSDPLFEHHILAGGTALALQIGHRTSTDVDLFTPEKQDAIALRKYFENNYNNVDITINKNEFTRVFVNGIKIELVEYEDKILKTPEKEEGIKYFGKHEIAAMKLRAILGRSKARDFIDVAYLLKEISLKEMFALYKEKFGNMSPLYMKRTLMVKSKAVKDDEWLEGDIRMLLTDIKPQDVPEIIRQTVEKYNETNKIGNPSDFTPLLNFTENTDDTGNPDT